MKHLKNPNLYYFYLLLICLAVSISGCKTNKVSANGYGTGKIASYTEIALNSNPKPEVVKKCLEGIKTENGFVLQVIKADAEMITDQQIEIAKKDSQLRAYHFQFVGDRTWFYARWIIGIWVGMYLLGLALNSMTGGFGLLIGRFILNLIPSPLFWLKVK